MPSPDQMGSPFAAARAMPLIHGYGGKLTAMSELPIHGLGDDYAVEGSGTVLSLPVMPAGISVSLRLLASPTFKNSTKLICPNGVDYLGKAGDLVTARSDGDSVWRIFVKPASGVQIADQALSLSNSQKDQANLNTFRAPVVTPLTGSGNWSPSTGCLWFRVVGVAPGGGGSGSGSAGGSPGGTGSDLTFGTMTAKGGVGGTTNASGSAGGAKTAVGAGFTGRAWPGGDGGGCSGSNTYAQGGNGGNSFLGGGGSGGGGTAPATPTSGKAETGGGGGGAAAGAFAGAGGGAGAGFDVIGTGTGPFAYVVPTTGGAAGAAGTSGANGAPGGTGSLYVEEYFAA
jgi:hypothetical protein